MTHQKDTMPDENYMSKQWGGIIGSKPFAGGTKYIRADIVQAKDEKIASLYGLLNDRNEEIAKLKQERYLLAREFGDYLDNGNAPATNGFMEALRLSRKIVRSE